MARKKLTPEDKLRRQHERKAERLNAAEAKAHGPLFAHLAPVWTPADAEARWRLQKAAAAEMDWRSAVARDLDWIVVAHIERWARANLGPIAEELIRAARSRGIGVDYVYMRWHYALTLRGRIMHNLRCVERPEWVNQYNREGRRVFFDEWPELCTVPYFTDEEFKAKFPFHLDDLSPPETDDERRFAELAALLAALLAAKPAAALDAAAGE